MKEEIWTILCSQKHVVYTGSNKNQLEEGFHIEWPQCKQCPEDMQRRHLWEQLPLKDHFGRFRPWGSFDILDEGPGYKVKRIEVLPGKRLSLQSHAERAESWTVVSGSGKFLVGDQTTNAYPGAMVYVGLDQKHRMINDGPDMLVVIEVQLGIKLDEADCIRYEDDYGRETKQEVSVR